jgi:hypothetical protein
MLFQIAMGVIAQMMERFSEGSLTYEEFVTGTVAVNDSLRKLALAKHSIVGTAEDENQRAIAKALDEAGFGDTYGMGFEEMADPSMPQVALDEK